MKKAYKIIGIIMFLLICFIALGIYSLATYELD